jgi:hypothetical protein
VFEIVLAPQKVIDMLTVHLKKGGVHLIALPVVGSGASEELAEETENDAGVFDTGLAGFEKGLSLARSRLAVGEEAGMNTAYDIGAHGLSKGGVDRLL